MAYRFMSVCVYLCAHTSLVVLLFHSHKQLSLVKELPCELGWALA